MLRLEIFLEAESSRGGRQAKKNREHVSGEGVTALKLRKTESFGREEIPLAEGMVTRKKRKSERAVPGAFDVVFFIISPHDSVFFIFYFLWLSLIFWALGDCLSM